VPSSWQVGALITYLKREDPKRAQTADHSPNTVSIVQNTEANIF